VLLTEDCVPRQQTGPFHMQTYIRPTCVDIPPDVLHNECAWGAPQTVESLRLDDKSNG
jgi:hypothetical protein